MNNDDAPTFSVRVYYEDTDAGGVVYHSRYLNFMERARSEWLRRLGFEQDQLIKRKQVLFAVRKISIDFHKPAHFNELLDITSRLIKIGRASFVFEQIIYNASREPLCLAEVKIACLDAKTMKPTPIPEPILLELR